MHESNSNQRSCTFSVFTVTQFSLGWDLDSPHNDIDYLCSCKGSIFPILDVDSFCLRPCYDVWSTLQFERAGGSDVDPVFKPHDDYIVCPSERLFFSLLSACDKNTLHQHYWQPRCGSRTKFFSWQKVFCDHRRKLLNHYL